MTTFSTASDLLSPLPSGKSRIRIVVACRRKLLCKQLAAIFGKLPDMDVLGCAQSVDAVLQSTQLKPDAILVDSDLLEGDTNTFIREMYGILPGCKIVLWSQEPEDSRPLTSTSIDGFVKFARDYAGLADTVRAAVNPELAGPQGPAPALSTANRSRSQRLLRRLAAVSELAAQSPSAVHGQDAGRFSEAQWGTLQPVDPFYNLQRSLRRQPSTSLHRRTPKVETARIGIAVFTVFAVASALIMLCMIFNEFILTAVPNPASNQPGDALTRWQCELISRYRGTSFFTFPCQ